MKWINRVWQYWYMYTSWHRSMLNPLWPTTAMSHILDNIGSNSGLSPSRRPEPILTDNWTQRNRLYKYCITNAHVSVNRTNLKEMSCGNGGQSVHFLINVSESAAHMVWVCTGCSALYQICQTFPVPGTRRRGRSRKTWSECVKIDVSNGDLSGVDPQDSDAWIASIRHSLVLPTPWNGTWASIH